MSAAVVTILAMWAVTLGLRALGLSLGGVRLPPFWRSFLDYVPVSVFAALLVPGVVNSPEWPARLLGCVVGGLLFWKPGNFGVGVVGGYAVYLAVRWALAGA